MSDTKLRLAILLGLIALCLGARPAISALTGQQILSLVNQDRIEHGLSPLQNNETLDLAAYDKAQDMFNKNYFAHTSPSGEAPWQWMSNLGYRYTYAGENLAEGFTNASQLESSWMASPSHRANILSPFYSDEGLAVVSKDNTTLVVQFFGNSANKVSLRQ